MMLGGFGRVTQAVRTRWPLAYRANIHGACRFCAWTSAFAIVAAASYHIVPINGIWAFMFWIVIAMVLSSARGAFGGDSEMLVKNVACHNIEWPITLELLNVLLTISPLIIFLVTTVFSLWAATHFLLLILCGTLLAKTGYLFSIMNPASAAIEIIVSALAVAIAVISVAVGGLSTVATVFIIYAGICVASIGVTIRAFRAGRRTPKLTAVGKLGAIAPWFVALWFVMHIDLIPLKDALSSVPSEVDEGDPQRKLSDLVQILARGTSAALGSHSIAILGGFLISMSLWLDFIGLLYSRYILIPRVRE